MDKCKLNFTIIYKKTIDNLKISLYIYSCNQQNKPSTKKVKL